MAEISHPEIDPHVVPEPRWPAWIAVLAVGGLYAALPQSLVVGPRWGLAALIAFLLAPLILTYKRGNCRVNRVLGHLLSLVVTGFMIVSLILLVKALPTHAESPMQLLRSAVALWATNVIVFAGWYWRLDGGGPHGRDLEPGHETDAFLFPQMALSAEQRKAMNIADWSPTFVDYLFLAFNTSTALSPTDTPVISRWAKILVMVQATISLLVIVLLAARAVNIIR
ncbi:hypothetical protein CCAX7_006550 [Capsulimonas corticalis]|uniref:Uncharacterized protein n=1 Tax=Capsulimonas corticalis TaxID=2219043 RepID=A0A402D1H1_9BACT|nr:hypothetical protein [Capsulimonas corticalis]BDI28604.1 hypothetical protein CCAX7_006550 [Capsulimonas corticalis]